jgi:hypothetical protein
MSGQPRLPKNPREASERAQPERERKREAGRSRQLGGEGRYEGKAKKKERSQRSSAERVRLRFCQAVFGPCVRPPSVRPSVCESAPACTGAKGQKGNGCSSCGVEKNENEKENEKEKEKEENDERDIQTDKEK